MPQLLRREAMSDWMGYIMPASVLLVYVGWGIATLVKRRRR